MRPSAFLISGFLLVASPHAAQPATPTATPRTGSVPPIAVDTQPGKPGVASAAPRAALTDVANAYDAMEKSIELQYGKLMQEAKSNKDALEDQIKNIDQQIERVKQEIKKLDLLMQKLQELLPKIMGALGSDSYPRRGPTPSAGTRDALTALLAAELARAGLSMSPAKVREISDAICKGGQGGLAVALQIMTSIAEATAARSFSPPVPARAAVNPGVRAGLPAAPSAELQSLLAAPAVPQIASADLSTAASLPGSAATAYFGRRFSDWAAERNAALDKQIDSLQKQKKSLQQQLAAIDKEIEKLQQDKAKALADLGKQKAKAVDQVLKAPTPTPK